MVDLKSQATGEAFSSWDNYWNRKAVRAEGGVFL